ncbi:hypothetical protein ONJ87_27080, partial [Salmonella enterica subsp. enterica serovar Anatum]|nr:hypothetical protein [Salmonella enterica subsp. enterica serovar Anatum]
LDFYGPHAADNAQALATLFRSEFSVQLFRQTGGLISPLYCSDLTYSKENMTFTALIYIDAVNVLIK